MRHTAEDRAHRYFRGSLWQRARRAHAHRDKLFHGSPEQLIAQLVEDEELSAADLRRLRALLTAPKKSGGGKK